MVILDPNGMTFDAVGVFGLVFFDFYLNLPHHTVRCKLKFINWVFLPILFAMIA